MTPSDPAFDRGVPNGPYAAPPGRYAIDITLDPDAHSVTGEVVITIENTAERPLGDALFHLYPNAFRDDETVFMRESGGVMRGDHAEGHGHIEVLDVWRDGALARDLGDRELVPDDRTQWRLPLTPPVDVGGRLSLRIRFRTALPPLFARAGHSGDFHAIAQFFPKLAVLRRDGTWRGFPYHANGEFFADFAHYSLTLRAPAEFVVEANGEAIETAEEDGLRVHRFVARRVHDVAAFAWPGFVRREWRCDETTLRLAYPEAYETSAEYEIRLLCDGLRDLGRRLGPYPYPSLVAVMPPPLGRGAHGMEYPGMTLLELAGPRSPMPRSDFPANTTVHELAHQWFQGMVASDELASPFLDESLTVWTSDDIRRDWRRDAHWRERLAAHLEPLLSSYFARERRLGAGSAANEYVDRDYFEVIYAHFPLFLERIARTYGRERLWSALGVYARALRFAHPTREDFAAKLDAAYWPGFARLFLEPALERGTAVDVAIEEITLEGDDLVASLTREGLPFPATIEARYRDGRRIRRSFRGRDATASLRFPAAGIETIVVDPYDQLLLPASEARMWRASGVRTETSGMRTLFSWLLTFFAGEMP